MSVFTCLPTFSSRPSFTSGWWCPIIWMPVFLCLPVDSCLLVRLVSVITCLPAHFSQSGKFSQFIWRFWISQFICLPVWLVVSGSLDVAAPWFESVNDKTSRCSWCFFGAISNLCCAHVGTRTACSFWAWYHIVKEPAVFGSWWGHVGPMWDPCWACVGPCWWLVGPKSGGFKPWFKSVNYKNESWVLWPRWGRHVGPMLGPSWTYIGPTTSC